MHLAYLSQRFSRPPDQPVRPVRPHRSRRRRDPASLRGKHNMTPCPGPVSEDRGSPRMSKAPRGGPRAIPDLEVEGPRILMVIKGFPYVMKYKWISSKDSLEAGARRQGTSHPLNSRRLPFFPKQGFILPCQLGSSTRYSKSTSPPLKPS